MLSALPLILLADDDAPLRLLLAHRLRLEGYHVVEASNGSECLQRFQQHHPDLILIDVVMPGMNGFDCCAQIKQDPGHKAPIIMMTALEESASIEQAFALGVEDYVTKPIHWEVLRQRIRRILLNHQMMVTLQHKNAEIETLNRDLEHKVQERTAQLDAQIWELQRLDVLKEDFISTVSHELRTPLTNMRVAILLLQSSQSDSSFTPKQKQYLDLLAVECSREIELINDLLNWQQLEAGRSLVTLEAVAINPLLTHLIATAQQQLHHHQLQLQLQIQADLPVIRTDPTGLTRILRELLNNACKHTSPGGEIRLQALADSGCIQITISNTGVIPETELPRLFDRFYRVRQEDPWRQRGTGLGLALVKRLIEMLQGRVQVGSSDGWIHFTAIIPDLAKAANASSRPPLLA